MNYLLEAMQHLGVYYSPLNLPTCAGKTMPVDYFLRLAGNPPFGEHAMSNSDQAILKQAWMDDDQLPVPCPFCGHVFETSLTFDDLLMDEDGYWCAVFCENKDCRASGPTVRMADNEAEAVAAAVAAWNRRTELEAAQQWEPVDMPNVYIAYGYGDSEPLPEGYVVCRRKPADGAQ